MNKEIKKINLTFPGQILDYIDTKKHLLELFNYITNLQEENKELKRMCELYSKSLYNAELTDYKSRCKKANEKLNELDFDNFVYGKTALKDIKKSLQNILNGSDENDKNSI